MSESADTMGGRIRDMRDAKEWTQRHLAELCGVTSVTVSRWETDAVLPSLESALVLADTLDVSLAWLTEGAS